MAYDETKKRAAYSFLIVKLKTVNDVTNERAA